jgi:hypothetical protein
MKTHIKSLYFNLKIKERIFIFLFSLSLPALSTFTQAGIITMTCTGPTIFYNFSNPEDVMRTGKALVMLENKGRSPIDKTLPEEVLKKEYVQSLYIKYFTSLMMSLASAYVAEIQDVRNGKHTTDKLEHLETENSCKYFVEELRKDVQTMPDGEIKNELAHILDKNTRFNAAILGQEELFMRKIFIDSIRMGGKHLDDQEKQHDSNSEERDPPPQSGFLLMTPI